MDAAITDDTLHLLNRPGRSKQAEQMYTLLGDSFKPRENVKTSSIGRLPQAMGTTHVIVIGHGDDFDALLFARLDDGVVVAFLIAKGRRLVVSLKVRERIYLQGALVKSCTVWERQGLLDRVCLGHPYPPSCAEFFALASVGAGRSANACARCPMSCFRSTYYPLSRELPFLRQAFPEPQPKRTTFPE